MSRTVTPGRSEIFSAKLDPALFKNVTCDLDAVDWYKSFAARGSGDAETITSASGMADGVRSNAVVVVTVHTLTATPAPV